MQVIIDYLYDCKATKIVQFGSSVWRNVYRDIDIFVELPYNEEILKKVKLINPKIDLHFGSSWEEFSSRLGIKKFIVL